MRVRLSHCVPLWAWAAGAVGLGLSVTPAHADGPVYRYTNPNCPPIIVSPCAPGTTMPLMPGTPATPGTPGTAAPATPGTTPQQTPAQTPSTTAEAAAAQQAALSDVGEASAAVGGETVSMIGDNLGTQLINIPSGAFGQFHQQSLRFQALGLRSAAVIPSVRAFKISENESPRPSDRVYYDFHYFDDIDASANRRVGSDLHDLNAYRQIFGFEKTFFDGKASLGMRVPLDTLNGESSIPGAGLTGTDFGDLTIIGKYALWQNDAGDLLSAGLAVTVPTGPSAFAGSVILTPYHDTILQPYVGYIWNFDRLFVHGFTALDIPTDSNDITLSYYDVGVGYKLYRNCHEDRWLTSVTPTLEAHANIPLDHRGAFNALDPVGTADVVDLTAGAIFGVGKHGQLALAAVTPVTGPRPFDFEFVLQFNLRFGPGGSRTAGLIGQ